MNLLLRPGASQDTRHGHGPPIGGRRIPNGRHHERRFPDRDRSFHLALWAARLSCLLHLKVYVTYPTRATFVGGLLILLSATTLCLRPVPPNTLNNTEKR